VFFLIFITFLISYLIILRPNSTASSETFNVYSDLQSIGDEEDIVQEENDKQNMEMTRDRLTENN